MTNKWIKRLFPLFAFLLLAPWPVAYAYDYTDGGAGQETVRVEVAQGLETPAWTAFGKAIGGVSTPIDLFYVDTTNNNADIQVNLYLTNTQELSGNYRYLILRVGVYVKTGANQWAKATTATGELFPDTIISLLDAQVSFTLPGNTQHKITIDGGSFYFRGADANGSSPAPQFYLTVE